MRYVRVLWLHDHPDEPIELLSELDESSWEIRKIERFRNGFVSLADGVSSSGGTRLGLEPMPSLQEINSDPEFKAAEISREEFEFAWTTAHPTVGSRTVGQARCFGRPREVETPRESGSQVPMGLGDLFSDPGVPLRLDAEDEDEDD